MKQQPRQSYNELDETEEKVSQRHNDNNRNTNINIPETAVRNPSKYRLILCVFIILLLTAGGLLVFFSTKEQKSTSHAITENSDNNETTMSVKMNETTTTVNTNKPTTTVSTNKPTTTVDSNNPTTTVDTKKPTPTVSTNKPTTTVSTNKPTTTIDTSKPTTTIDTKKTTTIVKTRSYSLPDNFANVYPDLTQLKGKHKEAYAFLFCTPQDADEYLQGNWLGIRSHIGKLTADGELEHRDLVIMTCPFVPKWQLDILHKTGAIMANVELITTTRPVLFPSWKTVFTKLHSYQLIQWERVLYMDIDILPMNEFYNIWDDPATKLVSKPPPGVDLNSKWYGQKVGDLYPYIQSGAFDTWVLDWARETYYFNGGIYVMKPSLPHWYALMNVTYNYSITLIDMDQRAVNTVYKGDGPVPWHNFSIYYDYSPGGLPMVPEVRAYHVKSWTSRDGRIFSSTFWERYDAMIRASYNITIIPESVDLILINDNCVQIEKLKLSKEFGSLYYWVNVDQTIQPTQEEIKAQSLKTIPISHIDEASIIVDNLLPNQIYNIFYFAETTNKLNTKTDVYQISFHI